MIGFAFCGSYCTFAPAFAALRRLAEQGEELLPIFSFNAASTDTRFGHAADFIREAEAICHRPPVLTIPDAEPLGPALPLDALLIAPCTGNTLAKLAHGITDSAVTMAAKAHLRNGKPLVIAVSTNDGLGTSAKNIGMLMNMQNIFFVPFNQDDPIKKPNSLVADMTKIIPAVECALDKVQIQPLFY